MNNSNFFSDLQGKINQAFESGPAKDIERNVKAAMTSGFAKLDLVTREEFDIQAQVLAKTRAKLEALELRVIELEARLASGASTSASSTSTTPPPGAAPSATAPFPAQPEDPTIVLPPHLDKSGDTPINKP
ncbi:membrane fusogenic activity family protein [Massilia timonae]|uniref:Ubiquinone biosynthesis accessory factor UbiK n=1 Tax=Massilia timonae TaxID=47229 RepID=A0A1S2NI72_9BURK|nr:membrane fusogenic activity family protein [Massilia timonae]